MGGNRLEQTFFQNGIKWEGFFPNIYITEYFITGFKLFIILKRDNSKLYMDK